MSATTITTTTTTTDTIPTTTIPTKSNDRPSSELEPERDVVQATLNYFTPPPDGSRPWENINADPITGLNARNFTLHPHPLPIENIRPKLDLTSDKPTVIKWLDTAGFAYARAESELRDSKFEDEDEIRSVYYAESEEWLKTLTGAVRVVIWDHTIRRRRPGQTNSDPSKRQPVPQVHTDQTPSSSFARIHKHLPPDLIPSHLPPKKRFQILNFWRPISHTVLDHPLALCDYRSIDYKNDLVPTTLKFPDREGETFSVKFNPAHRWKYVRGMTPDEVALIKCYDSLDDGSVAILTPHTAFDDPTTPPDTPLRESIELRTLIFYD